MEVLNNDLSLVTQVAVFRDKRAFDQLVRKYQSPIRRFLLNLTLGDAALSDDLAQETFLKAYVNISKFRGLSGFQTWLTRIAYNVFYDHKRRKTAAFATLDGTSVDGRQVDVASEPDSAERPQLRMDVRHALALLKEEERTCITLQLIEGYGINDIAQITGMPSGTVKSHLSRGKEKLANYLKENGYDRK